MGDDEDPVEASSMISDPASTWIFCGGRGLCRAGASKIPACEWLACVCVCVCVVESGECKDRR